MGWGEASLIGWEPMLVAAAAHLAPDWLGLSLDDAASQLRVSPQSPGGLVGNTVTSAVLQAVASLLVQARQVAPAAVLGPLQRTQVALYANINRATRLRTPEGFVATARRAQAQGFSAFKAAPFDGLTPALCGTPDGQARIRHGVACMLALREALGPAARLMVDCHWRFDEAHALQVLQDLAPAGLRPLGDAAHCRAGGGAGCAVLTAQPVRAALQLAQPAGGGSGARLRHAGDPV
ncbi:MAG: hypothetical protein NTY26_03270 [Burkholderiales bacterium]|nr:hypothetical protein [Burkholderiales bacterium]